MDQKLYLKSIQNRNKNSTKNRSQKQDKTWMHLGTILDRFLLRLGSQNASLWAPILLPKSLQKIIQSDQKHPEACPRARGPSKGKNGTHIESRTLKIEPLGNHLTPKKRPKSRPPLGHMEPSEACPGAPEAPNDSQHGAKIQPNEQFCKPLPLSQCRL